MRFTNLSLDFMRNQVAVWDDTILSLLQDRFELSDAILQQAPDQSPTASSPNIDQRHLHSLCAAGREYGLDESFVRTLFAEVIFVEARRRQARLTQKK